VDQHYNTQGDFLQALLANPADENGSYVGNLQQLVNKYPQSAIFHALLAQHSEEKNLKRAATYINNGALYKLINAPSSLREVSKDQIITHKLTIATPVVESPDLQDQPAALIESENYFSEQASADELPIGEEISVKSYTSELMQLETEEEIAAETEFAMADEIYEEASADNLTEIETVEEITEPAKVEATTEEDTENAVAQEENEEPGLVNETPETEIAEEQPQKVAEPIEEEVFDEITSVEDIHIEPVTVHHEAVEEQPDGEVKEATTTTPYEEEEWPEPDEIDIATEKLILNNIAGADFFSFDKAFKKREADNAGATTPLLTENGSDVAAALPVVSEQTDSDEVSKYHDDTLPYSFMWWLDKTREEHRQIYQPYAKPPAVANDTANKLEQQYYENIFHITSVEDLEKSTSTQTVQFDMKHAENATKEQQIIDRFLKEEPQIKPQSSDKLDNENKAKRSSEDKDDEMITETLAAIYTDQMLYHKAIGAYKKLMLKFPEKSVIFADKIEQLEKKTN